MFNALKKFLRILGPGIITGVADDDPSGIATYSQTGVQFGYGQLWTAQFMLPLLAGVQEACSPSRSWPDQRPTRCRRACNGPRGFYGVIIVATVVGLLLNFIGINPIKALVFTAVLNGVVAVPLVFIIALIARNKNIMGPYLSGWFSNLLVWLTLIL